MDDEIIPHNCYNKRVKRYYVVAEVDNEPSKSAIPLANNRVNGMDKVGTGGENQQKWPEYHLSS